MRASRKKRLARLIAALDEAEEAAVDRHCALRFKAWMCQDIREAMEWRGIDPAASRVLCNAEAMVAGFVDTPALQAADMAYRATHPVGRASRAPDPWERLATALDRVGRNYLDGSQPVFAFAALPELWAWALVQPRLLPAIPAGGYGVSEKTS